VAKVEDREMVEIDVLREMKREFIVTRERVPEASTALIIRTDFDEPRG
jgi:hypothetical protein